MSEQWQGLHNPNQHKRYKDECRCVGCGDYEWCASEYPCRCCLAAEVEVLRASVQRVRELHHLTVDTVDCREGGVEDIDHCAECGYIYVDAEPCPTIRAIEGGSDE